VCVDTGAPDNGWIQLQNVGVFVLNCLIYVNVAFNDNRENAILA